MNIIEASEEDWPAIWPIFHEIVSRSDTYAYERDTSMQQGKKVWLTLPRKTFICKEGGKVLGTYYLKTNQAGPGDHVCNCGYMVASQESGKGIATAMCEHSQHVALELGYQAMQFNFVASSNERAVKLWTKLGFTTVGTLPRAFNHPQKGYIDALVMYKWLVSNQRDGNLNK